MTVEVNKILVSARPTVEMKWGKPIQEAPRFFLLSPALPCRHRPASAPRPLPPSPPPPGTSSETPGCSCSWSWRSCPAAPQPDGVCCKRGDVMMSRVKERHVVSLPVLLLLCDLLLLLELLHPLDPGLVPPLEERRGVDVGVCVVLVVGHLLEHKTPASSNSSKFPHFYTLLPQCLSTCCSRSGEPW